MEPKKSPNREKKTSSSNPPLLGSKVNHPGCIDTLPETNIKKCGDPWKWKEIPDLETTNTSGAAVDGQNPAPVDMVNIPLFIGFLYIPGGCLGFLPSTVCHLSFRVPGAHLSSAGCMNSPEMDPTGWRTCHRNSMRPMVRLAGLKTYKT